MALSVEQRRQPTTSSRICIHRDADSLEIVQKPLRTGMPLWTILLFLLFDLGLVAFYFYMKQWKINSRNTLRWCAGVPAK